jgi:phospholipase C
MAGQSRDNALDHVVVVVLENRSLDNVRGRLYGPGDGKTFEGVTGKGLTNPTPELPADPKAETPPDHALHIIHNALAIQFPLLHPATPAPQADPRVRQL